LYKAQITRGSTENVQKLGVVAEFFFAKSAGRCVTPVIEIKPNSVSLRRNFYADMQLIRGRFWLQLWMLKKFSEPRVLLNDGAKEVGKWRK